MKAINRAGNLKRICVHSRRKTRQVEAQARQVESNKLTPAQRLKWLDQQGYVATRERKRLSKANDKP